ncbi:MAG: hypothetical protein JSS60_04240 [Verrucomicrobia bacterium]|nr:hypothetical protein [Verrucomicrobiota bacterium]
MACPFFQQGSVASISPGPATVVDAHKVSNWISRLSTAFPRFERIANHGSLSILEKEIQNITPLLAEGQEIASSTAILTPVIEMINRLAKPRLAQLQQTYTAAQAKVAADPKLKSSDEKLEAKWQKLGFPASVLEFHIDCARFLVDSGLAFTIAGYRETCGDAREHDLKLDGDGHPMIKMNGNFVRWETIARELEYDPKSDKIKSRGYAGNIVQSWNYFHPLGLVQKDRFNYDAAYPSYQLSQNEYDRLIAHSRKFYETNREIDPGIAKDCVVQFFTSPRRQGIPEHPLTDNLHENAPVHIAIRLITADKQVYSFGLQMPFEEQEFVLSDYFSTFLATALTNVSMRDYEEFRSHEGRIVTSVPLSSARSQNILNLINELNKKQLRFQYTRQNCSSLMQEVIQRAGYDVDIRTTAGATLYGMLPDLNQFPIIGKGIAKIEACARNVWAALPKFFRKGLTFGRNVIFYLPEKFGTIMVNLLMLKMGAAKKTAPLQEGTEDEELYNKKGLQNFSSVIRSWTDIFKDETSAVNHSKFFIDWQNQQKSTFVVPASSPPKMAIVPPVA